MDEDDDQQPFQGRTLSRSPVSGLQQAEEFHTPRENRDPKRPRSSPDDVTQQAKRPAPWVQTTLTIGEDVRENIRGLMNWASSKASKLTKTQIGFIFDMAQSIESSVRSLELAFTMEVGRCQTGTPSTTTTPALVTAEDVKAAVEAALQSSHPVTTYAQKVKIPASIPINPTIPTQTPTLLVYPPLNAPPEQKKSEVTKQTLMSIKPQDSGWQIAGFRKIRDGGVLVRTDSTAAAALKAHPALIKTGLRIQEPRTVSPKVMVYGVPKHLSPEDVVLCVQSQNLKDVSAVEIQQQLKLVSRQDNRSGESTNCVFECSPGMRNRLIKLDRVFIDWSCCRVQDYINLPRCYKCQAFNHIAKYCKSPSEICSLCATAGHNHKNCPTPQQVKCVNCSRFSKPCNHPAVSRECPAYLQAMEAALKRINYG